MSENLYNSEPLGSPVGSPAPSLSGIRNNSSQQDQLSEFLQNLNGRLEMLENRSDYPRINPLPSSFGTPKVALPDRFSGTIGKCRSFLISVENIFAIQPSRYPTDMIKTRFIGTLLSHEALSWFTNVVQHKSYLLNDYLSFIDEFKSLFDDPNIQRHASASLKRLKQGKGSVVVYSTKFRQLAPDIGYNECALIDFFREGLNDEIKDSLSRTMVRFDDLDSFIKYCIQIDQRIYDRRVERSNSFQSRNSAPNSFDKNSFNSVARNPGMMRGRPSCAPHGPAYSAQQGPSAMDLDATYVTNSKGFKHLSQEEKNRRRDMNLCLYCGNTGHDLTTCPKKPSKKDLNSLELSQCLSLTMSPSVK